MTVLSGGLDQIMPLLSSSVLDKVHGITSLGSLDTRESGSRFKSHCNISCVKVEIRLY